MKDTPLFKQTVTLLLIIAVLDLMAFIFYLHWTIWWYDVLLHFLSGVCVAMATVMFWNHFRVASQTSVLKMIFIALLGTFIVGFLWEVYELSLGATSFLEGVAYWRDTASDLIMDTSGGFFGALYAYELTDKSS